MRTTPDYNGAPRILVRIADQDRKDMSEKSVRTLTGETKTLYTRASWLKPTDKDGNNIVQDTNELLVRFGTVVGMSVGVSGIRKGDIAILDYVVDIGDQYLVAYEDKDKIVSVPCATTFCKKEMVVTSYDEKFIERNAIVEKQGDIQELSLVLGIIRGKQFIPNDHYIFCEPPLPIPDIIVHFMRNEKKPTHIERKVLFVSKKNEIKPGDTIIGLLESNMSITLGGRLLEIIPITDVMAIKNVEPVTVLAH